MKAGIFSNRMRLTESAGSLKNANRRLSQIALLSTLVIVFSILPFRSAETSSQIIRDRMTRNILLLGYDEDVANDFIKMAGEWKDYDGKRFITKWRSALDASKKDYKDGKIELIDFCRMQTRVARRLYEIILLKIKPVMDNTLFELPVVISERKAQCVGFALVYLITGDALGLDVAACDVIRISARYKISMSSVGHIACLVRLEDSRAIMVDPEFISDAFSPDKEYEKPSLLWHLKNPDSPLQLHRSIRLMSVGQVKAFLHNNRSVHADDETAIKECDIAIKIDPRFALAYLNRAISYDNLGNEEKAMADIEDSIGYNPYYGKSYSVRAKIYHRRKEYENALKDHNEAISLSPEDSLLYSSRADTYLKMGEKEKASEDVKKALELDPNNLAAFMLKALIEGAQEEE